MPERNKFVGKIGEDAATKFFEDKGFKIIERNFRIRSAEIDLIVDDGETLIFAEVKARSNIRHGLPAEAVDFRKRKKIIEAAGVFLQNENFSERACRFDVVEVYLTGNKIEEIRQIENAFEVSEDF